MGTTNGTARQPRLEQARLPVLICSRSARPVLSLQPGGGGGALKPGGGGGALKPGGGGGLSGEITHETANSYARPPRDLTIVQEEASPRLIDLSWFAPTFA